jgi:hypothetical protein
MCSRVECGRGLSCRWCRLWPSSGMSCIVHRMLNKIILLDLSRKTQSCTRRSFRSTVGWQSPNMLCKLRLNCSLCISSKFGGKPRTLKYLVSLTQNISPCRYSMKSSNPALETPSPSHKPHSLINSCTSCKYNDTQCTQRTSHRRKTHLNTHMQAL